MGLPTETETETEQQIGKMAVTVLNICTVFLIEGRKIELLFFLKCDKESLSLNH